MIDIDVLSTAAGLKEFDAATVAAYCQAEEERVILVLDGHPDLFAKRIPRHQAYPASPRYRVLHPDALARRISSFSATPDFSPWPGYAQIPSPAGPLDRLPESDADSLGDEAFRSDQPQGPEPEADLDPGPTEDSAHLPGLGLSPDPDPVMDSPSVLNLDSLPDLAPRPDPEPKSGPVLDPRVVLNPDRRPGSAPITHRNNESGPSSESDPTAPGAPRTRPRPRSGPRPRRPERGDQAGLRRTPGGFTSGGYTSGGYTSASTSSRRTPLDQNPSDATASKRPPSAGSTPARNPAPWNRSADSPSDPTLDSGQPNVAPISASQPSVTRPAAPQPHQYPQPHQAPQPHQIPRPAQRRHSPGTHLSRPSLPQLGAPSVPNPDVPRAHPEDLPRRPKGQAVPRAYVDLPRAAATDLPRATGPHPQQRRPGWEADDFPEAGADRLEVIHGREPEPDPRLTHAESTLLACARERDPQARHALASAAMSALSECVPNLPRDGELHTAELPPRLRFALTLATLTLIESTGQPIARKLLVSAYDDATALAQEFLPSRQADLISRFRALASGRSGEYPGV